MAFGYTIENEQILEGNMRMGYGTWDSDSVTGGEIVTGLGRVDICVLGHTGSAVEAAVAVCNEKRKSEKETPRAFRVTRSARLLDSTFAPAVERADAGETRAQGAEVPAVLSLRARLSRAVQGDMRRELHRRLRQAQFGRRQGRRRQVPRVQRQGRQSVHDAMRAGRAP